VNTKGLAMALVVMFIGLAICGLLLAGASNASH
jgi:hypothetical protein